jgi:hypothetical protein
MEDHGEMEGDSSSNVSILSSHGTFITVTEDGSSHGTVTGSRYSWKSHRVVVNVSEELLNRQIQDMGWSHLNDIKVLCGPSSRSTDPRSSRVMRD